MWWAYTQGGLYSGGLRDRSLFMEGGGGKK